MRSLTHIHIHAPTNTPTRSKRLCEHSSNSTWRSKCDETEENKSSNKRYGSCASRLRV